MARKAFERDYLVNQLDLPCSAKEDNITHTSRWSIHHSIVFQDTDGKYYRTTYSEGATEDQEEHPWEYEPVVECEEVELKERKIMDWVPVKEGDGD